MIYDNIVTGTFIERPNRFVAKVLLDGRIETVHVKNTGRCRELLIQGRTVFLEPAKNPDRKTKFSLIAVDKDGLLVNMDSQAPNQIAAEALAKGHINGIHAVNIKREVTYGNSRFDLFFETENRQCFMEVKGVTLEEGGNCRFPDAPTIRGTKHVEELIQAAKSGYGAYVLFVLQMEDMKSFRPNGEMDPLFSAALKKASKNNVNILAWDCYVTKDVISLNHSVPILL